MKMGRMTNHKVIILASALLALNAWGATFADDIYGDATVQKKGAKALRMSPSLLESDMQRKTEAERLWRRCDSSDAERARENARLEFRPAIRQYSKKLSAPMDESHLDSAALAVSKALGGVRCKEYRTVLLLLDSERKPGCFIDDVEVRLSPDSGIFARMKMLALSGFNAYTSVIEVFKLGQSERMEQYVYGVDLDLMPYKAKVGPFGKVGKRIRIDGKEARLSATAK